MITTHKEPDRTTGRATVGSEKLDSFERLLWWLFTRAAGGRTRLLVLSGVRKKPRNAQQLSQDLGLDYTTIRHHLKVLETNNLVIAEGEKYGRVYFVSEMMESHWDNLETINKRRPRSKERAQE